jgi:elongation of very long chain fatty acids protein 6
MSLVDDVSSAPLIDSCRGSSQIYETCFTAFLGNDTHGAAFYTPGGHRFVQLWELHPWMKWTYSELEMVFNPRPWVYFAADYFWLAIGLCALYALGIEFGRMAMKNREPFGLRGALIWWNALLAVFSIAGTLRTLPHLLHNIFVEGFEYSICAPAEVSYGCGGTGFWTALFIFSKVPELGDTLFLVLRKRPVQFLHWYHHISVLLYAWWSYATRSSAGLWFIAVNYLTHAVMYSYYAYTAAGGRNESVAFAITTLQISQMVVGLIVCFSVPIFAHLGSDCAMTTGAYVGGIVMYGSYFYLFFVFAVARYCRGSKKPEAPKPASQVADEKDEASVVPNKNDTESGLRKRRTSLSGK